MLSYAQTNLQLFNQVRHDGYTKADLDLVRDAYESAMTLFSGRFQPSGKSFIAHVVGTASILASLRLPAPVVAASLLHAVYVQGDFGNSRRGISIKKRREITRIVGEEAEGYVARFPAIHWGSETMRLARDNPEALTPTDRNVVLIKLADYLEHLLDYDLLYYSDSGRRYYRLQDAVVRTAASLGLDALAAELKEAIRTTESGELPVQSPAHRAHDASFVFVPRSYRKRFSAAAGWAKFGGSNHSRPRLALGLNRLQKRALRFLVSRAQRIKRLHWIAGCLERKSDNFESLFRKGVILERVAKGFQFTEGPVWIAEEQGLLFSDIPANRILRLEPDHSVEDYRRPSGHSNGLTRDRQGRLITCEHGNRRVTRTETNGSITVLAEVFQGKRLNSPNDVIVKSDGAIYFTDPSYGIKPAEQEQAVQGVYRLSPDGQELSLVAEDLARPNGLAFSPDEKKLYIDDSHRRHIRVFDVREDGSLSGGSVFHDMNVSLRGSPDGMKVDVEGHVYCTGAGGVWVFTETGEHLGTIVTPEKPSNCAWGDSDRRTLYITAVTSVYK
ncbi:MAG: SMP-30/gluconolactonase/LRE family protein, partial [Candidatus Binatia bacterium]